MKTKNKLVLVIISFIVLFVLYNAFILFNKYGFNLIGNKNKNYRYHSENGEYSIQIPTSWAINEITIPLSGDPYLITTFSTFSTKVFMNVRKYDYITNNREELVNEQLMINTEFSSSEILQNVSVNESETLLEYTYIRKYRDYPNHCYDLIVMKNGGYVFTFCSANKLWEYTQPMFEEMINSITIDD